jgi:hypothetical protein
LIANSLGDVAKMHCFDTFVVEILFWFSLYRFVAFDHGRVFCEVSLGCGVFDLPDFTFVVDSSSTTGLLILQQHVGVVASRKEPESCPI